MKQQTNKVKIYETFQLIKKENRRSYFIGKEHAKKLADFIYQHL